MKKKIKMKMRKTNKPKNEEKKQNNKTFLIPTAQSFKKSFPPRLV